jgi:hypothetical protein
LTFSPKKDGSGLAQEHFLASRFSSTSCSPLRLCTLIVRATIFYSRVFENLLFQISFLQNSNELFILFFSFLIYILALGAPQAVISEEAADEMEAGQEESKEEPRLRRPMSKRDSIPQSLTAFDGNNTSMFCSIINFNYMMFNLFVWFLTWTQKSLRRNGNPANLQPI